MTYFEDQMEAWEDNNCQGNPSDIDPYSFWADRISACEAKGHGTIKTESIQNEKGIESKVKVCQNCKVVIDK